jgi:DNA modification methylase
MTLARSSGADMANSIALVTDKSQQIIVHGDCAALLQPKRASHFDVMITDPPYSEHVHRNATSQSPGRGARKRDMGFASLTEDLLHRICDYAAAVRRWSVVYSDVEGHSAWREVMQEAGATYIRPMAWVRWSMPQLSGDRPPQGFELVTCYWGAGKGRKSWNGPGNLTHLAHKCLRGEGKHKAEKPLDQCLDLVSWFSEPGERVLDPCAGHGTIGLACRILGREYEGWEIDSEWTDKARERILAPLSERDAERLARWAESQRAEGLARKERDANTKRVREKCQEKAQT